MIKTPFLFLFPFFAAGCIITNTPGFYSGYKKIATDQKQNIIFVEDDMDICNIKNDKKIYAITATQLLKCLQNNDSTLVYLWSPNCSSKGCVLLDAAQNYCERNNYVLYVITEYYDLDKTDPQNNGRLSMFAVNQNYYKTDYCNKYCKLFIRELTEKSTFNEENDYSRYYVFHRDTFVGKKININTHHF